MLSLSKATDLSNNKVFPFAYEKYRLSYFNLIANQIKISEATKLWCLMFAAYVRLHSKRTAKSEKVNSQAQATSRLLMPLRSSIKEQNDWTQQLKPSLNIYFYIGIQLGPKSRCTKFKNNLHPCSINSACCDNWFKHLAFDWPVAKPQENTKTLNIHQKPGTMRSLYSFNTAVVNEDFSVFIKYKLTSLSTESVIELKLTAPS